MTHRYIFWIFLLLATGTFAQDTKLSLISSCRQEIIQAFTRNSTEDARFWLDSLQRLGDDQYLSSQWDERWLLYYWVGDYPTLFREAAGFSNAWEEANQYKVPPPQDSLFSILDNALYNDRAGLFDRIRQGTLSVEEVEFADLLLNYLLRLSTAEADAEAFDKRLEAFRQDHPKSRFETLIRSRMYNTPPPGKWALGADLLLYQGNWTGNLERNLRTSYGADLAIAYWQHRWNLYLRIPVGVQKLDKPIEENGYIWEKDESSTYFGIEAEGGFDVISKSRLRILPTVGGGFSSIHPPEGSEENPNPDYFQYFKFRSAHLTAALQADVKFNSGKGNTISSYHGIRVRIGLRWLNFGRQNPSLQGNMFFFAVGYTLFGRQPQTL